MRELGPGDRVPNVAVYGDHGRTLQIRDLTKDRPTLLVFVRCTYCTGCMAYAKHMAEWTQSLKDANLNVLFALTEDWKPVFKWASEDKIPMTVLADERRKLAKAFGVYKTLGFDSFRHARPSAFLIDNKTGTIRWSTVFPDNEELAPKLKDYLDLANRFWPPPAKEQPVTSAS